MRRDQIRERVFAPVPAEKRTKTVEAFGCWIVLHKLNWKEMEEARKGCLKDGEFDEVSWGAAMLVLAAHDERGEAIFDRGDFFNLLGTEDGHEMSSLVNQNIAFQVGDKVVEKGKADSETTPGGGSISAPAGPSDDSPAK